MKKIGLIITLTILSIAASFAQRNNIAPEIQADRDMVAVERKMQQANEDEEAVRLIKEHAAAKKKMDATMKQLPGYGKAATDKKSLSSFREKNSKKDASFKLLSDKEKETRLAKESYISTVNEGYKMNKSVRGDN